MLKKIAGVAVAALMVAGGPAMAEKQFEGVSLRVLANQDAWSDSLKAMADQFTEETGATVQFDQFAFGQAVQKITVELTTKSSAYDLVFVSGSDVSQYSPGGFLEPLSSHLANRDIVATDPNLADFIPATLRLFQGEDGEQYALPNFAATQIMFYNAEKLAEAGFEKPPETWQELYDYCSKLGGDGDPCTAMRGKPSVSENMWYFSQMMYGYGARFFADYPNDMTPTVNSEGAVQALELYGKLLNDFGIPGSVSAGFDEVTVAMQQDNVDLVVEGAPLAGRILDPELSKVIGKLGFALPPAGPEGRFAPFAAQGYAVNAASKNKEAAVAFLAWSTSSEVMKQVTLDSSFLAVTRSSVWNDADYRAKHDYNFGHGSFSEAYEGTLQAGVEWYRLPFPEFNAIADRVGLAVQEHVVGSKSAQEALDDAQKDITTILKRAGRLE
ncbi:MAG: sugar ABC transporter substrate-binding protein [Rhizobiaceae bacterium]|nr:sugar ABC transporter substrate-binding protein [Rhizobiaceae bacterium]